VPPRAASVPPRAPTPPPFERAASEPPPSPRTQSGELAAAFVPPASGGPDDSTGMSREVNLDDEPPSLFDDAAPSLPPSLAPAGGNKSVVDSTTEIDIDSVDVVDEEEDR
jgi:hypothetical protein